MKKLKKQMITKYLQRVRAPHGMVLKDYHEFYAKLFMQFGNSKNLKIVSRSDYYSSSGYWLIERRLETNEELAKRQAILAKKMAKLKILRENRHKLKKIEAAKWRAIDKNRKAGEQKAKLEAEVEKVKTMVAVLKAAGFNVSKNKVIGSIKI
jgi:hypothetical protein